MQIKGSAATYPSRVEPTNLALFKPSQHFFLPRQEP